MSGVESIQHRETYIHHKKDNMPQISVIVPVYNAEKYLHRCIDSILSQPFTDFELLLIDDGSKDRSGEICDEYGEKDTRVNVFHKENGGVSSARNMGLDNAKGEWISFVDADDWIEDGMLSQCAEHFVDSDMVLFDFHYVDECRVHIMEMQWSRENKIIGLNKYIGGELSSCSAYLFKKKLIENNSIRFMTNVSHGEDFNFSVKLLYLAERVYYLHRPLYYYDRTNEDSQLHNESVTSMRSEIDAYIDVIKFFSEHNCTRFFEKRMSWRILKAKQDLVLDCRSHTEFLNIYPKGHHYILSCPYINNKMKMLCFTCTHEMRWITVFVIICRNMYNFLKNKTKTE